MKRSPSHNPTIATKFDTYLRKLGETPLDEHTEQLSPEEWRRIIIERFTNRTGE